MIFGFPFKKLIDQGLGSVMIAHLNIPSLDTARIQEGHILVGHIICQLIEDKIFS